MIVSDGGRSRSIRTIGEERKLLEADLESLGDAIKCMDAVLDDEVGGNVLGGAIDDEFERRPVGVEEFLRSDDYLGKAGKNLYPILVDDMVELFSGGYCEAILGGSLGWGKSYFSTLGTLYSIYLMSCLRNPQKTYGLDEGSAISVSVLSVTENVARRSTFTELLTKMERSPYFQEEFPYQKHRMEVHFIKKPIMLVAGSTASNGILSLNIFGGVMDEANFLGKLRSPKQNAAFTRWGILDKAEEMYNAIVRRIKSRYMRAGKVPGVLFMPSSKTTFNSFTERRIKESKNDPTIFVREYNTWEVKRRAGYFSKERFKVLVGNERVRSKILDANDDPAKYDGVEGIQVIDVPTDYRKDFERNLEDAIREIAGLSTAGISLFFQRGEKLEQMFQRGERVGLVHPFAIGEWVAGTPLEFAWQRVANQKDQRLPGGYYEKVWVPRINPEATRFVRIDPSWTGDCTGLAIGHIASFRDVVRRDEEGKEYNEVAPVIWIDALLRIIPPPGDEIMLGDVRAIIYQFQEHGFNIVHGSSDQYQAVDTKQQLSQRGIETEISSVDKTTAPYSVFKTAIYEDRVCCYPYPFLLAECKALEYHAEKGKVDHPTEMVGPDGKNIPGSKDVADAACGLVHDLTVLGQQMPLPPSRGPLEAPKDDKDDSWVTGGLKPVGGGKGSPPNPFIIR